MEFVSDSLSEMTTPAMTARSTEEQDLLQRSTKKSKRGHDSTVITPRMATDEVIQETPLSAGLMSPESAHWRTPVETLNQAWRSKEQRNFDEDEAGLEIPNERREPIFRSTTGSRETSRPGEENEESVPQELACTPPINQVMNTNLPWIRTNQHTKKTTEQPRSKESASRVSFVQEQARYTHSPNRGGTRGRGGRSWVPKQAAAEAEHTVVRGLNRGKQITSTVVHHVYDQPESSHMEDIEYQFKEDPPPPTPKGSSQTLLNPPAKTWLMPTELMVSLATRLLPASASKRFLFAPYLL
nr:uncharacterized protein LOC109169367 [Ipomoea batatas]